MSKDLPLAPIEADFEEKAQQGIEQLPIVEKLVDDAVRNGLKNVAFVGAGGSIIASYPAFYVLERRSSIPVYQIQSDEFNTATPVSIGPGSLVVLASYTGTTKETVAAAKRAKETGATVAAIGAEDSPLTKAADVAFKPDSDLVELMIAYRVLEATGESGEFDDFRSGLQALPKALLHVQEESEDLVKRIAENFKDEDVTYLLGSGPLYGWAYGMAMCYLQEMQWMHAAAFNAGEFFQGAFEVVNKDTAVLLALGEDDSRPMAERAKRFLDQYAPRSEYIDLKDVTLPGVPDSVRGDFGGTALRCIFSRLAKHYEHVRNHSLEERNYMFKFNY